MRFCAMAVATIQAIGFHTCLVQKSFNHVFSVSLMINSYGLQWGSPNVLSRGPDYWPPDRWGGSSQPLPCCRTAAGLVLVLQRPTLFHLVPTISGRGKQLGPITSAPAQCPGCCCSTWPSSTSCHLFSGTSGGRGHRQPGASGARQAAEGQSNSLGGSRPAFGQ